MNIASRQSFWNSGVKIAKGAYIRSVDGKLGYAISNGAVGLGHYRISWRGSIAAGSPAAGNGWTGPMGTITKDLNTEEKCLANAASNKWNADKNECYILGSENNATTRTEDKKRG